MARIMIYHDLEVYRMAHDLAVEIHRMTLSELPRFEQYEEASQIRRSAKSISMNIVAGFGRRRFKADYLRFLIFSHASCDETIGLLMELKFHIDHRIKEQTMINLASRIPHLASGVSLWN